METSHLAGDSWQQGGTVILNKDGKVEYVVSFYVCLVEEPKIPEGELA